MAGSAPTFNPLVIPCICSSLDFFLLIAEHRFLPFQEEDGWDTDYTYKAHWPDTAENLTCVPVVWPPAAHNLPKFLFFLILPMCVLGNRGTKIDMMFSRKPGVSKFSVRVNHDFCAFSNFYCGYSYSRELWDHFCFSLLITHAFKC